MLIFLSTTDTKNYIPRDTKNYILGKKFKISILTWKIIYLQSILAKWTDYLILLFII